MGRAYMHAKSEWGSAFERDSPERKLMKLCLAFSLLAVVLNWNTNVPSSTQFVALLGVGCR